MPIWGFSIDTYPAQYFNNDIATIPGIHANYLYEWGDKAAKSRSSASIVSNPLNTRKSYPSVTDSKLMTGGSMIKAIALSKLLYLTQCLPQDASPIGYAPNKHRTVICLGGHWVPSTECEGDHAYPAVDLEKRFRLFCTQVNQFSDNLRWNFVYLDAKNLMGLCKPCNQTKSQNWSQWVMNNKYLGSDYFSEILPLDCRGVVPRTRNGVGLGDSMTLYFFNKIGNRRTVGVVDKSPDEIIGHLKTLSLVTEEELSELAKNKELADLISLLSDRFLKLTLKK